MLLGVDCCRERKEASLEEKRWAQDVDELREHFKDFDASVQELLSHIKEAYAWRIKEVIPSTWLGENGRIIIIGDAAHSSLPWSGQVCHFAPQLYLPSKLTISGGRYGT
jgi:2-polyprenyl-6-methoxyphenol hydroxylase-like FAD-dependent oxidoreductase